MQWLPHCTYPAVPFQEFKSALDLVALGVGCVVGGVVLLLVLLLVTHVATDMCRDAAANRQNQAGNQKGGRGAYFFWSGGRPSAGGARSASTLPAARTRAEPAVVTSLVC